MAAVRGPISGVVELSDFFYNIIVETARGTKELFRSSLKFRCRFDTYIYIFAGSTRYKRRQFGHLARTCFSDPNRCAHAVGVAGGTEGLTPHQHMNILGVQPSSFLGCQMRFTAGPALP